ncbi:MAG TPA: beta-ketoacyl synthase N-terminal-like domain-containing protein [Thermoanaerobaculia bacterium]
MSGRVPGSRLVVTGAGAVSSAGLGVEPLAAALAAGTPATSPIDRLDALPPRPGAGAAVAHRVTTTDLGPWLSPREARRMSPPSRWAVVACRQALAAAGLAVPPAVDPATAVVLSSAYGAPSVTQALLDQLLAEGPEAMSPFHFMESVANAPAGQAAIHCRAGGPNHTLCQREAGPVAVLGRAAGELAAGRAERVLAGAVEEMTPLLFSVLERFGAVAPVARPFDRRRRGFVPAEGATVLLVEAEAAARRRGARARARLAGWGGLFDPTASPVGWGTGAEALAGGLVRGLARFGLAPGEIDLVVSGGSGSRDGDRLEAAVLARLFAGGPRPPVLAPKGVTGEYAGGFLAAALAALAGAPLAATAGFAEPDPELDLVPHDGSPLGPVRRLLVTSFAAGGGGAWVILEPPDPP